MNRESLLNQHPTPFLGSQSLAVPSSSGRENVEGIAQQAERALMTSLQAASILLQSLEDGVYASPAGRVWIECVSVCDLLAALLTEPASCTGSGSTWRDRGSHFALSAPGTGHFPLPRILEAIHHELSGRSACVQVVFARDQVKALEEKK